MCCILDINSIYSKKCVEGVALKKSVPSIVNRLNLLRERSLGSILDKVTPVDHVRRSKRLIEVGGVLTDDLTIVSGSSDYSLNSRKAAVTSFLLYLSHYELSNRPRATCPIVSTSYTHLKQA